jgi:hypothetical protein
MTMTTNLKLRFRPTLEHLEAREVLSANLGAALLPPATGPAQINQAANQMQVDFSGLLTSATDAITAQNVSVQNGVADVTQAARTILENDILTRIPQSLSVPLIGEVKLDSVKLDRLTLDKDGNFNGQMTVTFKYELSGIQYAKVQASIVNNQLKLSSDNPLVSAFGKLEERQQQWQPKVTEALNAIRPQLMSQFFGTQGSSATGG